MITTKIDGGTAVYVGVHRLCTITAATDPDAVKRFIECCKRMAPELHNLAVSYEEKRAWNMEHSGQGKNWPVFGQMEKMLNKLLKEAEIKDS